MDNEVFSDTDYYENLPEVDLPEPEPVPPKICILTLADGTKLENLRLNGTNFVSEEKIDENIFTGNLSTLTVNDGETETILHNAELIQQVHYDDGWYICFREKSEQEVEIEQMRKSIAAMTEINQSGPMSAMASVVSFSRMMLAGEAVDTDDKRLQVSALYPNWAEGNHLKGEIYNADGQTWECFQAYDNAVYPDIRPGETAWHTFNRPLHGTSPETARPFVPVQGAHDMYKTGEYMIWTDGTVFRCLNDTNFSPEEYPGAWEAKLDTMENEEEK